MILLSLLLFCLLLVALFSHSRFVVVVVFVVVALFCRHVVGLVVGRVWVFALLSPRPSVGGPLVTSHLGLPCAGGPSVYPHFADECYCVVGLLPSHLVTDAHFASILLFLSAHHSWWLSWGHRR